MDDSHYLIDYEKLRRDLEDEMMGACFAGGFGGAILDYSGVSNLSEEDLVVMARQYGISIEDYYVS